MSANAQTLNLIARQVVTCVGPVLFIIGFAGSCANLWLFSRKVLRKTPCSYYILLGTLLDFLQLFATCFLRILTDVFAVDVPTLNNTVCRIRAFILIFTVYGPLNCRCLAAFDRFACTSRVAQVRRRWSSLQMARTLMILNLVLCSVLACPYPFFYSIINVNRTRVSCTINSATFAFFHNMIATPILAFIMPCAIQIGFVVCTIFNVRRMTAAQRRTLKTIEKHLTSMVLLQTLVSMLTSVPLWAQIIYSNVTASETKDEYRLAQENLFFSVTRLTAYFNITSSFYIYMICSREFRSMFVQELMSLVRRRTGRVIPFTTDPNQIHTNSRMGKPPMGHVTIEEPAASIQ